jgi:hypothetical protein
MITFDRSQSRGAYAGETLHISLFETSWPIPGPCVWGIRTIDISTTKSNQDLYPSLQAGLMEIRSRVGEL